MAVQNLRIFRLKLAFDSSSEVATAEQHQPARRSCSFSNFQDNETKVSNNRKRARQTNCSNQSVSSSTSKLASLMEHTELSHLPSLVFACSL
ncbi:hypothetical protein L1887_61373 [Cichorium endivia]|nr:hypothetical protein L1887_61373 [Cichorium endivia]